MARARNESGDQLLPKDGTEVLLQRSQSSVLIKQDGKGTKSYEVKVYDDDPEVAKEKALALSKNLDERLPGGNLTG